MSPAVCLERYRKRLGGINPLKTYGRVSEVVGLIIEGRGLGASIGEVCDIETPEGDVEVEVVGFRDNRLLMMPLGEMRGVRPGSRVISRGRRTCVTVGPELLGRVLDGRGRPIDGGPQPGGEEYPIYGPPINPLRRGRIREPMDLGIRAVNGLLTVGRGQRMGIMAGAGVGKSVLLGMIARNTEADLNVIALIGERGREVREFLEKDLGAEGLRRSVVVIATSDQPPLVRLRGAFLATAVAESFRDAGKQVLLMMDSLTRFAMAQREVGLAVGEPPTTKGYTPSVFALLPRLLERAGPVEGRGSMTGLYTVLAEGDDMADPVADAVKAIVDGHIVLSRRLANENHYPAIDVLESISRVMPDIVDERHLALRGRLVEVLSTYRQYEDVVTIGAYKAGSNPKLDEALRMLGPVRAYLRQGMNEKVDFGDSLQGLYNLFENGQPRRGPVAAAPEAAEGKG